ncbi:ABC transporter ATP-binding protein [Nonomuraea sp. K274]|uniref:ABC-type quaternary amine transporter n=1 Tax=Nonomuraea cypriaca TaxID=1187855 RepID=A0A931EZK5_9ACTN|nr:ABC transporter ATP-binding protein [Nonomuraea cypriaca]MBF8185288.1 ABC transporter ATP-binding protein [Nonomuraea cypriaca]
MTSTPDAELRGIRKVYDNGARGVEQVDFAVAKGEFFSMLGPSGCGKSTTLRILAGLEEPTSGEVLIRGESMRGRPPHRRPTNMVFQRLALFPHLTVADNVAFGPRLQRKPARRVGEIVGSMLELVDLDGFGERYPSQLSGGQQQRVAIARALANEPAVLLLDEPLGALDLRLRVQMQQALKRIQHDSGTTFVYVTHDQVEALTMSDRMAVMNEGRIEQIGPPADLYRSPATTFTATFLGDTNLFEGACEGGLLESAGISVKVAGTGRAVSVRPEHVAVGKNLTCANRYHGRLEDVIFQGASTRYHVRLASGVLVISERREEAGSTLAIGDDVETGWDVDAGVVLNH